MRHKHAEREHAKKRFWERLGIVLMDEEYRKLCEDCQDRTKTHFIKYTDNRNMLLAMRYKGHDIKLVFNPFSNRLVTVLTPQNRF